MDSSAKRTRSATPVWHDGLIAGDLERSKSINDLKDIKPSWANNAEGLNGPAHKASGSSMIGQMSSHDEHVQDPIKSTNQTVVVGTNEPAASKTAMGSHSGRINSNLLLQPFSNTIFSHSKRNPGKTRSRGKF